MVPLNFFDYQWYPRVIERFTPYLIFFVQNRPKQLTFFLFLLFFNLKEKEKNLMVMDDFGQKKLEKFTVVKVT